MSLKSLFLAVGLAVASFGVMSLVAPGDAQAHPGHHEPAPADKADDHAGLAPDGQVSLGDPATDLADGRCFTVCCVGSSCCPSTIAAQAEQTPPNVAPARLVGFEESRRAGFDAEPPPRPPRSVI